VKRACYRAVISIAAAGFVPTLAGCFNPNIPEGRACSNVDPACPPGQTCSNGVCGESSAADATVDSRPRADAPVTADAQLSLCPPADDDTIALYRFDGDVLDSVGFNHGMPAGESFVAGAPDCDLALTYLAQIFGPVIIADAAEWDLSIGSVDFWIYPVADDSVYGILSRDATERSLPGHFSVWQSRRAVALRVQSDSANAVACTADGSLTDGKWHHVVANFGPPVVEIYLDGVLGESSDSHAMDGGVLFCDQKADFGIDGNDNPWVIGASSALSDEGESTPVSGKFVGGRIDNLRISSKRR